MRVSLGVAGMIIFCAGFGAWYVARTVGIPNVHWVYEIYMHGSHQAYERFAKRAQGLDESITHAKAHQFASVLYALEGISAIRVCDERFAQGCAHEVIGRAVHEYGVAIVPQVQHECAAAFGEGAYFCDHGVGHGLVDYYGYTREALDSVFAYCDAHERDDPLRGCYTGAFMEYFL